ncbi:cytochrome C551 [Chryseobacterium sp. G0162]|uniref:cytochrome C551 n=1 Tax=Chryseobacterium sp. G0162 TaxID=2487063 RepID=UPI000F4FB396|nr:cytochrome C551 [Chryseobacterium sp. G0162]AZB10614.1 cytochrome C551 [Chryseobacterium sp. G0162]
MKKLLLTAIGIGLFAVSCGTKESSMSTSNSDSANTRAASPMTTDTMTTKMTNPDSMKMKKDSMTTPPAK